MTISIRQACIDDCPIIAEAVSMAIGEESSKEYCGENHLQTLGEVAATDGSQYFYANVLIAEVDGEPAGAIVGYDGALLDVLREKTLSIIYKDRSRPENFPDETEPGEFYIDSIGVLPRFRGLGIGRKLVQHICAHAFEKGHKVVGLIVDKENLNAEKLYTSIGFTRVGTKMFFNHEMWHLQITDTTTK